MPEIIGNKLYLAIASLLAIAFVSLWFLLFWPMDHRNYDQVEITVANGDGLSIIASKLSDVGLIRNRSLFEGYVWFRGYDNELKTGRYMLSKSSNIPEIVSLIVSGKSESDDIEVTIPEGFNVWEIDKRFAELKLIRRGQLAGGYIHKEGHLFPDTYRFEKETAPLNIIDRMGKNYFSKGGTRSEITLIVASLLEKEAKTKEDMELVAGIIYKRLERKMLLQIDASVAYGWCLKQASLAGFGGFCDVTQAPLSSEIKVDGSYNTYIRAGLPAGAISNPGLTALGAAANPRSSEYLYYLSTRDGSQIIYSKTPAEHAANRRKYLGI